MLLDYSIPSDFQFQIGGVDYAKYLDSFNIALPIYEPGQPLSWSGAFTINFDHGAIRDGLTPADFDQATNPTVWRPGLQPVRIIINGYTLPILRIERYSYNAQTREGKGTLYQINNVVDYERPQIPNNNENPTIFGNYSQITVYGTTLTATVRRLLQLAFRNCAVSPTINSGTQTGGILGGVTTRNPIADCNKLLASQWQWLTVDNAEAIQIIEPFPQTQAANWSRSIGGVEIDGDIDHNYSPATRIIVTGSYQREEPLDCQTNPPNPNPNLDRKGRPTVQRTEEKLPFSTVFEGQTGLTPTLSLVKWIFYQYPDDLAWDSQLWQFIPAGLIFELQQDQPLRNAPIDQPCQTVTVEQWPAGRIFGALGTNTTLRVASITYQSERRRVIYQPAGVLSETLGTNFTLTQSKYEKLLTEPVILGQELHAGQIDPRTGQLQCLEPPKKPEERQPAPQKRLITQAVSGRATLTPLGWTPLVSNQTKVVDLGFIPGDGQATKLAQRLGFREQIRRDTYKVVQPLPIEWLIAHCPVLPVVSIAGDRYLAQGLILSMQAGELKFAYSAARITYGGLLGSVETIETDLGYVVEIDIALVTIPTIDLGYVVEIDISLLTLGAADDLIFDVEMSITLENAPAFSSPDLEFEIDIT